MQCSVCGKEAVINLPAYHKALCSEHFVQWYYEKTKHFTKKLTRPGDRIALAVSGGKDSIALALFFNEYRKELDVDPFLFHIDLGIPDYSKVARRYVEKLSSELGMELFVYDLKKETGKALVDLRRGSRPPCSACGIIKRYLMNKVPRELGADSLATGHNLDDQVENFFKNWTSQHFDWLAKQKPFLPGEHPKLLPKIKPLFERTEEENMAYVKYNGFELPTFRCPFSHRQRSKWRLIADEIESRNPGFKLSVVKALENFDYPVGVTGLRECSICGEPTSQDVCSFCKIIGKTTQP